MRSLVVAKCLQIPGVLFPSISLKFFSVYFPTHFSKIFLFYKLPHFHKTLYERKTLDIFISLAHLYSMNPTHELDDLLAGLAEVEEPTPEPSLAPALIGPWPAKLSFDVAFGESDDVIRAKYNLSEPALQSIYLNPTFRKEVSEKQAVLREEGITFKTKAKMQAEMYLENVHDIINSETAAPSVKLDAIKSIVKWAGYEPKPESSAQGQSQQKTQLVIQWQDGSGTVAIQT